MKSLITRFLKEEDGATMVEYAILVALISVVAIVVIGSVGGKVDDAFQSVDDAMS
ncbi:Flp family type IVb pilin [Alcanivorax sediminis]|uniref:Flp family type IVb pilin n=1 Tax=Alcanivorax sediminis TaxID=2663008 RepID=A0A6N7LUT7_9GAMM|nr:Flp family type IVb pilin [Alcanivorax sediminis]MQX52974.1 Flp family type IVb pilin [Alcanivorax sediminis]